MLGGLAIITLCILYLLYNVGDEAKYLFLHVFHRFEQLLLLCYKLFLMTGVISLTLLLEFIMQECFLQSR